ncbi:MAG: hypothetical protein JXQ75_17780 [Phycisphaerae bacterium]|nr:hypothetical protein [Phycisphaerae bacterium]
MPMDRAARATGSLAARVFCVVGLVWASGCTRPHEAEITESASFTVDDILGRCVAAYEGLRTLQAQGLLRDYRGEARRVATIGWDFVRPDRCRLQIDMDVALVLGKHWWTYDTASGRYRNHVQFTRTPIETAASLLSKGVPFLTPAILTTGERAFGGSRSRGFVDWTVEGVGWHAEHPCYVVSRRERGQSGANVLRVWIDQDQHLVRGWALEVDTGGGRDQTVMGCSYYVLAVDEELPSDRLQLNPPKQILLPEPAGLAEDEG